ncbi:MAG: hypothetical protein E6R03_15450 [Hyphomicrobiaceae bacterium]|nr:MAG: hypothetical protein E6R03_15450 [Hyphomicrobiaceae bacterium]
MLLGLDLLDNLHLVIDGNYFLHLSIPYNPKDAVGPHVASYNFFSSLAQWSTRLSARSVTVCWDSNGAPEKRYRLCPTYKTNGVSPKTEKERMRLQDFNRNREFLKTQILPYIGVRQLCVNKFEADDLIFGISKSWRGDVIILTADKDLLQLVSSSTYFLTPGKEKISEANISSVLLDDNYDIRPRKASDIIGFKGMRGDRSDNIPAVLKPRAVSRIWTLLRESNLDASITNIRKMAESDGIQIQPGLENNFEVVDLARSGVAGDAIGYALQSASTSISVNESILFDNLLAVGIQPGYVHKLVPSFYFLK